MWATRPTSCTRARGLDTRVDAVLALHRERSATGARGYLGLARAGRRGRDLAHRADGPGRRPASGPLPAGCLQRVTGGARARRVADLRGNIRERQVLPT